VKMTPAQMLLDGSEEAPAKEREGFMQFMKVSQQEEGLFLPAQAAQALDVSHPRVLQLMAAGQLRKWEFFGKRYVSCREVKHRRDSDVKNGRPKRSFGARLKSAVKIVAGMDVQQVASAALE
jgi:hypothetical protein